METMKRLLGALASTRIFKGAMTAVMALLLATPALGQLNLDCDLCPCLEAWESRSPGR